jgi:hypothetical protein
VGAGDTAPDGAELSSPDLFLRLVDKAHTLAQVVGSVLLGNHLVDLEERGVLMLVAKPPLETHHHALNVQPTEGKTETQEMGETHERARRTENDEGTTHRRDRNKECFRALTRRRIGPDHDHGTEQKQDSDPSVLALPGPDCQDPRPNLLGTPRPLRMNPSFSVQCGSSPARVRAAAGSCCSHAAAGRASSRTLRCALRVREALLLLPV